MTTGKSLHLRLILVYLFSLVCLAGCREDEKQLIVLPVDEEPEEDATAPIELDGDLSDWDDIEELISIDPTADNSLETLKATDDEDNIYVFIQGVEGTERAIFQIFVNADNDTESGFDHWEQPGISGLDVLYEYDGSTLNLYSFDPSVDPGWPWPEAENNPEIGKVALSEDKSTYEVALSKSFMGDVGEVVSIKVMEADSTWATIGKLPAAEAALPEVEL